MKTVPVPYSLCCYFDTDTYAHSQSRCYHSRFPDISQFFYHLHPFLPADWHHMLHSRNLQIEQLFSDYSLYTPTHMFHSHMLDVQNQNHQIPSVFFCAFERSACELCLPRYKNSCIPLVHIYIALHLYDKAVYKSIPCHLPVFSCPLRSHCLSVLYNR